MPGIAHQNMSHVRTDDQRKIMEKIDGDGVCPFCEEHLETYHRAPVEIKGKWWNLTKNDFPYEGAKHHYLAISRRHVVDLEGLLEDEFAELRTLLVTIVRKHNMKGGTILMRFGDTDMTGATVSHIHAHLIVGGARMDGGEKMKVTVGYKNKDSAQL